MNDHGPHGRSATDALPLPLRVDLLEAWIGQAATRQGLSIEEFLIRNRLDVLIASARRAEGLNIGPAQQDVLDDAWRIYEHKKMLAANLARVDPNALVMKGSVIGDRYPAGWLRVSHDLDIALSAPELLWPCVRSLGSAWMVEAFSLISIDGGLYPSMRLVAPWNSKQHAELRIELTTAGFLVGRWNLRPAGRLDPRSIHDLNLRQLLALIEERVERPFHARDCLDATILFVESGPSIRAPLWRTLDLLGWWPEFIDLLDTAERLGLLAGNSRRELAPSWGARSRRRARRDRLRARARLLFTPIGQAVWLTHLLTLRDAPGRLAEVVAAFIQRRGRARRALATGLPLFGIPLEPRHVEDQAFSLSARAPPVACWP